MTPEQRITEVLSNNLNSNTIPTGNIYTPQLEGTMGTDPNTKSYIDDGLSMYLTRDITTDVIRYPEENIMSQQIGLDPNSAAQMFPAGSLPGTSLTPGSVPPSAVDITPPNVVTGINLSDNGIHVNDSGQTFAYINVTWTASTATDLAYYEVRIKQTSGGNYAYRDTGTNAIEIFPLIANAVYYVSVRAFDKFGNSSAWASDVSVTTAKDTIAPGVPTGLTLTPGFKVMGVKVNKNTESDLFAYRIQRSANGAFAGEQVTLSDINSYFFVDQGLSNNTQYWYRVSAVDTSGNASSFCASVSATTNQVGSGDIAASTALIDQLFASTALVNELMVQYNSLGSTQILPGKVVISGSTSLADWRNGTDTTKIEGGQIYANSVTANKINVGSQPFSHNIPFNGATADTVNWTSGTIQWADGTTAAINAGSIAKVLQNAAQYVATGAALLSHFDEISGTSIADASTNNNTATGKNDYLYQRTLTINSSMVSGSSPLTDFPVLVDVTDTLLKTVGNGGHVQSSSGFDIFFTLADGTRVWHEIESYTASTGHLICWVKIPTLSNSANTILNMYYGKSGISTTTESSKLVWNSSYEAVYHMNSLNDSTGNAHTLTATNAPSQAATGKIGNATSFTAASSQYLKATPTNTITGNFTVEAWAKPTLTTPAYGILGSRGPSDTSFDLQMVGTSSAPQRLHSDIGTGTAWINTTVDFNNAYAAATFVHIVEVVTQSGGNTIYTYYINGAQVATGTAGAGVAMLWDPNHNFFIGQVGGTSTFFDGTIDEVRISNTGLSSAWIATSYNTQNTPGTYLTLGSEASNTTAIRNGQSRFGGYSRFFDGGDDYINYPYISAYGFTGGLQIDASIYPTAINGAREITSKSDNSNNENLTFRISDGKIQFVYTSAPGVYHAFTTNAVVVAVNNWYDIRFTYTYGVSASAHIYINNIEFAGSWTLGNGNAAVSLTNQAITIGKYTTLSANFFSGFIDEVRIKTTIDTQPTAVPYFIYYNASSTLSFTTNYVNVVGDGKKLLAIWTPKVSSGLSAVQIAGGSGTTIDGDVIKTGRISSQNGLNYKDLANGRDVFNDGVNDRMIIGYYPGGF